MKQEEADKLREEHKIICRQELWTAAWKGAAIWGSVGIVTHLALQQFSVVYKARVGISAKAFIVGGKLLQPRSRF